MAWIPPYTYQTTSPVSDPTTVLPTITSTPPSYVNTATILHSATEIIVTANVPVNTTKACKESHQLAHLMKRIKEGSVPLLKGACDKEGLWNCIDGKHFQKCTHGAWNYPQRMPLGTLCVPGIGPNLIRDSVRSGRCDRNGQWNCINDGKVTQLCACGRWTDPYLLEGGRRCAPPGVSDTLQFIE